MVFQCATLVCSTPGIIFGTLDSKFGPRLGWGPFFGKKGGLENMNLWRNWFPMGFGGNLCEGIGLYGAQEAFGQAHFPPNPARKSFYRDFPISRKIPGPPWAPGGSPIGPLKELLPILPPAALPLGSWLGLLGRLGRAWHAVAQLGMA